MVVKQLGELLDLLALGMTLGNDEMIQDRLRSGLD
jgi:hypothetical protein